MIVNLEEIVESGLSLTLEKKPEAFPVLMEMKASGELNAVNPIITAFKAIRVKDMVEVEGVIKTAVGISCSRCLTDFTLSIHSDFALTFTKKLPEYLNNDSGDGQELTAEEMGMILYKGEKINLRDAIQEQLILSIPFKPLCSETCKGLCMHCGSNLNEGDCGCK